MLYKIDDSPDPVAINLPTNIVAYYVDDTAERKSVHISWTPPTNAPISGYYLSGKPLDASVSSATIKCDEFGYLPLGCGMLQLVVSSTNGTFKTSEYINVQPTPLTPDQLRAQEAARVTREAAAAELAARANAPTAGTSLAQCQEDKRACEAEFTNMTFGGFAVNSVAADGRTLLDHCLNDGGVWAGGKRRCDPDGCHC
jgi:hypothetical protein